MKPDLTALFDRRVPRYTSYPTAARFHDGVDAALYARWLEALAPEAALSLYVHLPFCRSLCWFCGCHMAVANRYEPVAAYRASLEREIAWVAQRLGPRRIATHIHWGGGTPTLLTPGDIERLAHALRGRFDISPDAEFAVEVDPRGFDAPRAAALGRAGVSRASLGVQDADPAVQEAIHRRQPVAITARAVDLLRAAGIAAINLDLMYGLPLQTAAGVVGSVEAVLPLAPDRLALFGYAHVPWLKRHQRLIDESRLPDSAERLRQFQAAAARLAEAGYVPIGIDHFARPDDPLAVAQRAGRLRRNFQGYTADPAPVLLGFGASAIGALPQGYAQNLAPLRAWREAVERGGAATARGIVLGAEDRLRRAIIERLMCDLAADLDGLCRNFAVPPHRFATALEAIAATLPPDLVSVDGWRIRIAEAGRPFARLVAAAFDADLRPEETRFARAV